MPSFFGRRGGDLRYMPAGEENNERKPQGWKCMPYIIGNETFGRLAGAGLSANLTVYLVNQFHMKQVQSINVVNIFYGTSNFATLAGAFVSDAYLGRYKTLAYASVIYFLGMLTMTLTASLPQLRPPSCSPPAEKPNDCSPPSDFKLAFLYLSLSLLVVGAGGILPCTLPFGVDQFDRSTEQGRRALTSFFNWYYFITAFTLFFAITVMSYVQNSISWPIGFGIPTFLMLLAIVLFFLGSRMYVLVFPEGSIFSSIPQVFVAALRKRHLCLPHPSLLYNPPQQGSQFITQLPCTPKFPYLNKAAIELPGEVNLENRYRTKPWRLCSVQQIEEVKCLLRIIPIWASGILLLLAFTQQWTFVVLQSLKMDRRLGHFSVPPGSVGAVSILGLAISLPVYDQIFVPSLRRFTKLEQGITMLQRQGTGLVISVLAMVVAAVVEWKRRNESVESGGTAAMSVMWLAPQLMLMGLSDAFNLVAQIEFYNKEFPEQMQSIAGSLIFLTFGFSSYLSSFFVSLVRKATGGEGRKSWVEDDVDEGRLDYYYYMIAVLQAVNFLYFLICARFYIYKGIVPALEEGEDEQRRGR